MVNRIIDIRLVVLDSTEEDKDIPIIIEELKKITGTKKDTEILKMCIRMAYENYYKKLNTS